MQSLPKSHIDKHIVLRTKKCLQHKQNFKSSLDIIFPYLKFTYIMDDNNYWHASRNTGKYLKVFSSIASSALSHGKVIEGDR